MVKPAKEIFPLEKGGKEAIIHYIGKRYYTIETFTKEALKYGVSRALPHTVIKKLNWGDRIYTAFYEKDEKGPYALVFGYFIITGLNVADERVTAEAKKDERLKVVKTSTPPSGGGGSKINRGCGSYMVGETTYIDNDLSELVEIIEDAEKKLGIHTKLMVAGKFYPFPQPIAVRNVQFSRSIIRVNLPEDAFEVPQEVEEKVEVAEVTALKGYKLGRPSKSRKKKVQEALEVISLDNWLGGSK